LEAQPQRVVLESAPREVKEVLVDETSDISSPPIMQFHNQSEPIEIRPESSGASHRTLSEKMLNLYSECFRHFPHWTLEHDSRVPEKLSHLNSVTTLSEDRLQFRWDETDFTCAMLPQSDDSSILSFSVNDKEHLKLKIQLEIGTYELLETLLCADGKWVEQLESLALASQPQAIKRAN
jgi:hypothetical protein